jgi:hypothetical protein
MMASSRHGFFVSAMRDARCRLAEQVDCARRWGLGLRWVHKADWQPADARDYDCDCHVMWVHGYIATALHSLFFFFSISIASALLNRRR